LFFVHFLFGGDATLIDEAGDDFEVLVVRAAVDLPGTAAGLIAVEYALEKVDPVVAIDGKRPGRVESSCLFVIHPSRRTAQGRLRSQVPADGFVGVGPSAGR
jgi:hypothetical protein